ncbi:isochorismatase family protein [Candidatus Kuenenbacteria bacterium]|nr:isochorismatase family protein [Candidatus Kuenenbacteria bacterium]
MRGSRRALVVVDVMAEFMPGGAVPAEGGDEIVEPINVLMKNGGYDIIVIVLEGHSLKHSSFKENGGPYDTHGVWGTEKAEPHPDLKLVYVTMIMRKGIDDDVDCYSGFASERDVNGKRRPTGLRGYLLDNMVDQVDVVGLTFDICAFSTAVDSSQFGFETRMLKDCTRSLFPENDEKNIEALEAAGVVVVR